MHRNLSVSIFLSLAGLLAPVAGAEPLHPCPGSPYTAYYVLWGLPAPGTPVEIDTHSGTLGGNHEIDELQMPTNEGILSIVCSVDEPNWLSQHALYVSWWGPLNGTTNGELFGVYSSGTGAVAGTVWRDLYDPFDQGGAMGYQKYWSRTTWRFFYNPWTHVWIMVPPSGPVLQNVAMFSSGLDRAAINDTAETDKDSFWFQPISLMLNTSLDNHIRWVENYSYQYTKQAFMAAFGSNVNTLRHDDLVDPTGGSGGIPP